ncbi:hypothetical protein [Brachyspira pilosicoli]|uniref:Uncharacterized protein n=1 Tax=Brachyspira pilosicoli TaxID=52584 RepID=A0A5C8EWL5_BRAPL|nr:hypothetical protein [Brachyspira pilosicoli]TXJ42186.1 hypothetical protein EPJ72_05725 [Brachyspira pilosicoli]
MAKSISKNKFINKPINVPRLIAKAETLTKYDISQSQKKEIEKKLGILKDEYFNLNGAYPYVIDFINYMCTFYKDDKYIHRKNNNLETHYLIYKNSFFNVALGEFQEQRKILEVDIYRTLNKLDKYGMPVKPKVYPLNATHSIHTDAIRFSIINKDINNKIENLKNINGEVYYYAIEFLKPIWNCLLGARGTEGYIRIPSQLQAKIVHSINKYKNDPKFTKYGNFGKSINYRQLFLYLSLHDNGKSAEIEYDFKDIIKKCFRQNTQVKGDHIFLKDKSKAYNFIKKGLELFNQMASDGLIDKINILPYALKIKSDSIVVSLHREKTNIPKFEIIN